MAQRCPGQLARADHPDRQPGLIVSPDGAALYYNQDKGGNELSDVYSVPTAGGAAVNLTNTPDISESAALVSPDGGALALTYKPQVQGQTNLALLDVATRLCACWFTKPIRSGAGRRSLG